MTVYLITDKKYKRKSRTVKKLKIKKLINNLISPKIK